MSAPLSPRSARCVVFQRPHARARLNHPVSDDVLRKLYDLLRMGPTSTNCCPGRFVFVRSKEAKHRLAPAINPANIDRTMTAPVTVIVATDTRYHEHLPQLWPHDEAPRLKIVNALCLGDEGIPQWHVAGRLFDYRGPCPGIRLGTAVGLQ